MLDLFYGDLTVNRAYVYARLPRPADDAGLSLVGQVRGPRCLHAQTLPLTSPLVDLGPGPTLLARALVPDPCFWSPDLPAIYDVTVNLLRGTELVATARGEIGLRSLGVRGHHLSLESKRWVLRGVTSGSTTATLPRAWHEAHASLVTGSSNGELAEASQWGALSVVEVGTAGESAVAELRALAHFPAAAIAIIRGELAAGFKPSDVCPNLLLGQAIDPATGARPQPWAQLLLALADDPQGMARLAASSDMPIVALRRLARPLPIAGARAACDVLQRDLASVGQFAGYVV